MYKTTVFKNSSQSFSGVFSTADFNLAATLVALGLHLINMDETNPKRFKFIFRTQKNLNQLIESYWNDTCMVSSLSLFNAQKVLKGRIFGEQN